MYEEFPEEMDEWYDLAALAAAARSACDTVAATSMPARRSASPSPAPPVGVLLPLLLKVRPSCCGRCASASALRMGARLLGAVPAGRVVGPQEGSRSLSIPPDLEDAGADGKMQGRFLSPAAAQKAGFVSWRRGSRTPVHGGLRYE
jgi:hypothetical protein